MSHIRAMTNADLVWEYRVSKDDWNDAVADVRLHMTIKPPKGQTLLQEAEYINWQETYETLKEYRTVSHSYYVKLRREMERRDRLTPVLGVVVAQRAAGDSSVAYLEDHWRQRYVKNSEYINDGELSHF